MREKYKKKDIKEEKEWDIERLGKKEKQEMERSIWVEVVEVDVRERYKHNFTKNPAFLGRGREVRVGLKYVTDAGLPDMRGPEIH